MTNGIYAFSCFSDMNSPEMVSKELTAFLCAIRKIKKRGDIKQKYEGIKGWKPKLEWMVIQKRILDRFAVDGEEKEDGFKLSAHSPAFFIPSDVVSGEYFEVCLCIEAVDVDDHDVGMDVDDSFSSKSE